MKVYRKAMYSCADQMTEKKSSVVIYSDHSSGVSVEVKLLLLTCRS